MGKPFSPRKLTARIKAVLRRSNSVKPPVEVIADFAINRRARTITYSGEKLELAHYEYELLLMLLENREKILSRSEIMLAIWNTPGMSDMRTVDTHIKTIRKKLNRIKQKENLILTHRGHGYSFNAK